MIRLQKFLSLAGICSRRQGEQYIIQGKVSVNGKIVKELGAKADPDKDKIEFEGRKVSLVKDKIYIAVNKPRGYVTSCRQTGAKLVTGLVKTPFRLYPVGRLDKDSTGLLLLTNDGDVHLKLSHPSFNHEKEYEVYVAKPFSKESSKRMADGVKIDGVKTRPAYVKKISDKSFKIVLKEGRNRQIRKMVKKVGNTVISLKRIRIGDIMLGDMPLGAWRLLSEKEKKTIV